MPSLIGSKPNQVPVNADLGTMAFQDAENIAGDVVVGGSLTVNGVTTQNGDTIQAVTTTAATLDTNNTLTFSIVDDSTLRVSVRGSDGVTRTGTVALT